MAERILVGKVLTGKGFVYDHHISRRRNIVFGKEPSAKQRQSECLKITVAAHFKACVPWIGVRFAGNNCVAEFVLQRRWISHFGNRGNTRESPHTLQELARQGIFPLQRAGEIGVIGRREVQLEV